MKVLAITGYDRSGKDTVIEYIEDILHKCRVEPLTFSQELKNIHMSMLGIAKLSTYNEYLHNDTPYHGINLRQDIYRLSTTLKEHNPDRIVNSVRDKLVTCSDRGVDFCIIGDVRFNKEYSLIQEKSYPLIRVVRNSVKEEVKEQPWNVDIKTFKPTYTVFNNGSLDDLYHETFIMLDYFGWIN